MFNNNLTSATFYILELSLIQCYDDKNCMPSSTLQCCAVCNCVYYSRPRHSVIPILLLYVEYRVHLGTLARVRENPKLVLCKLCSLCVFLPGIYEVTGFDVEILSSYLPLPAVIENQATVCLPGCSFIIPVHVCNSTL